MGTGGCPCPAEVLSINILVQQCPCPAMPASPGIAPLVVATPLIAVAPLVVAATPSEDISPGVASRSISPAVAPSSGCDSIRLRQIGRGGAAGRAGADSCDGRPFLTTEDNRVIALLAVCGKRLLGWVSSDGGDSASAPCCLCAGYEAPWRAAPRCYTLHTLQEVLTASLLDGMVWRAEGGAQSMSAAGALIC